jgi:hypothetical protein
MFFVLTATTKNEHLNEHFKCMYLFLSVFYAVQQSDDFLLVTALRPSVTHLPGPSDAVETLTEVTCTQQRTKSWNKLPTFKSAIPLM